MHHFVVEFSKKIRLRRKGGIDPLTEILRTPPLITHHVIFVPMMPCVERGNGCYAIAR